MTVQELYTQAITGPLSNLALNEDDDASIAKVMTYINQGLTEINKTFTLNTAEVIVDLVEGTTRYAMPATFMKVMNAYNEAGVQLPMNKEDDLTSVFTPVHGYIDYYNAYPNGQLSIIYLAEFPQYSTPNTDTLPISQSMSEALLLYIGYKGYAAQNPSIDAPNNAYYMRFKAEIKNIRELGLTYVDESANNNLFSKGFI